MPVKMNNLGTDQEQLDASHSTAKLTAQDQHSQHPPDSAAYHDATRVRPKVINQDQVAVIPFQTSSSFGLAENILSVGGPSGHQHQLRRSSEGEHQQGATAEEDEVKRGAQRKRSASGDGLSQLTEPQGKKSAATSAEQKRDREKRRRSELNETLDDLSELVFQIDPSLRSGRAEIVGMESISSTRKNTITNRTELIQCTVRLLRRLNTQNLQKDKLIAELQLASASAQPAQGGPKPGTAPSSRTPAPPPAAQAQAIPSVAPSTDYRSGLDPSSFLAAAHQQGYRGGVGSIPSSMGQHLAYGQGGVLAQPAMGASSFPRDAPSSLPAAAFMPFVSFPSAAGAAAFRQGFYPGAQMPGVHAAAPRQANSHIYGPTPHQNLEGTAPQNLQTQQHSPALPQQVGQHPAVSSDTKEETCPGDQSVPIGKTPDALKKDHPSGS